MFPTKPKIAVVVLLGAAAVAASSGVLRHPAWAGQPAQGKSASQSKKASSWQVRATLDGHTEAVRCVAFSKDGKTLASASEDFTVNLYDVATGKLMATLAGHTEEVWCVAFSPDGKTVASGSCGLDPGKQIGVVKLWDATTGKERATLEGYEGWVWSVAFSPDGKVLAAGGSGKSFRDANLVLWDVATGKKRATLDGHTAMVDTLAFSPDGKTLATGSHDYTSKLWDWAKEKEILTLEHEAECFRLAFSPDGKTLATQAAGKVTLWDVDKGQKRTDAPAAARGLAFSPDGKTLALGNFVSGKAKDGFAENKGEMKLLAVDTGKELETLKVDAVIEFVAFSPDGKLLAAGCRGKEKAPTSVRLNEKGEVEPRVQGDRKGSVKLWELKPQNAKKE